MRALAEIVNDDGEILAQVVYAIKNEMADHIERHSSSGEQALEHWAIPVKQFWRRSPISRQMSWAGALTGEKRNSLKLKKFLSFLIEEKKGDRFIFCRRSLDFCSQSKQKLIVETPIPKAQRGGKGKLNNPAKRRV